jgi:hypothetical protein
MVVSGWIITMLNFQSNKLWARTGFDSSRLVVVARRGRTLGHVKSCVHKTKNNGNVIHFNFSMKMPELKAAA